MAASDTLGRLLYPFNIYSCLILLCLTVCLRPPHTRALVFPSMHCILHLQTAFLFYILITEWLMIPCNLISLQGEMQHFWSVLQPTAAVPWEVCRLLLVWFEPWSPSANYLSASRLVCLNNSGDQIIGRGNLPSLPGQATILVDCSHMEYMSITYTWPCWVAFHNNMQTGVSSAFAGCLLTREPVTKMYQWETVQHYMVFIQRFLGTLKSVCKQLMTWCSTPLRENHLGKKGIERTLHVLKDTFLRNTRIYFIEYSYVRAWKGSAAASTQDNVE